MSIIRGVFAIYDTEVNQLNVHIHKAFTKKYQQMKHIFSEGLALHVESSD